MFSLVITMFLQILSKRDVNKMDLFPSLPSKFEPGSFAISNHIEKKNPWVCFHNYKNNSRIVLFL